MTQKQLKIPEIGETLRHVGKLLRIETIPIEPQIDYIFEDDEYRMELRRCGVVLKTFGSFADGYMQSAIVEMVKYAESENIGKDSEVELVVVKVATQYRMMPTYQENFYADGYTDFRTLEHGSRRDLPDPVESVIWSSKD
jgi:hypothetical protein